MKKTIPISLQKQFDDSFSDIMATVEDATRSTYKVYLEEFQRAAKKAAKTKDLADIAASDEARANLIDVVEEITSYFSGEAANIAAQYYEHIMREVYELDIEDAVIKDRIKPSEINKQVRSSARHLFGFNQDIDAALEELMTYTLQEVGQEKFAVITDNVKRDEKLGRDLARALIASSNSSVPQKLVLSPGLRMGFARVPYGVHTCAFCWLLASRGYVYHTKVTAGGKGHKYHAHCDCQIIPGINGITKIEGYDPDKLYRRYLEVRETCGSGNPNDILNEARRRNPDYIFKGTPGKVAINTKNVPKDAKKVANIFANRGMDVLIDEKGLKVGGRYYDFDGEQGFKKVAQYVDYDPQLKDKELQTARINRKSRFIFDSYDGYDEILLAFKTGDIRRETIIQRDEHKLY